MPDEDEGGRQWVVEPPPAAGEVSLYLACGDDVELSEEQQAALGALISSLEARDAEVVGHHASCPDVSHCDKLACTKVACGILMCLPLGKPKSLESSAGWSLTGSFGPAAR